MFLAFFIIAVKRPHLSYLNHSAKVTSLFRLKRTNSDTINL